MWPVTGKYVGWPFNEDHYDITSIPVNKRLEDDKDSTVVAKQMAAETIRRSGHRVIISRRLCRTACCCKDNPMETGYNYYVGPLRGVY